jgi:hypothetical protein
MKIPLKLLDYVAILCAVALTGVSAFLIYARPYAEVQVSIRGRDAVWVFPLNAEEKVSVPGSVGETIIEIHAGEVRVLSSPCVNQTCVTAGHIHAQGQWLACLPNEVFVSIEGRAGGEALDASTW